MAAEFRNCSKMTAVSTGRGSSGLLLSSFTNTTSLSLSDSKLTISGVRKCGGFREPTIRQSSLSSDESEMFSPSSSRLVCGASEVSGCIRVRSGKLALLLAPATGPPVCVPEVDTETIPLTPAPPKEPVMITVWSDERVSIVNWVRPLLPPASASALAIPDVPGIGSTTRTTSSSPSDPDNPEPEDDDDEDDRTTTLLL